MTSKVNGKTEILIPCRSETPEMHSRSRNYVCGRPYIRFWRRGWRRASSALMRVNLMTYWTSLLENLSCCNLLDFTAILDQSSTTCSSFGLYNAHIHGTYVFEDNLYRKKQSLFAAGVGRGWGHPRVGYGRVGSGPDFSLVAPVWSNCVGLWGSP